MPPWKNMNINDVYEQEFKQRTMARMKGRLDHFADQMADRMNDMMYLRRRGDRNGRRIEDEESENPFFKGDGGSSGLGNMALVLLPIRQDRVVSTCTILGKVCNFVVDPGSCDNLIAEEAVKKLGLKSENHPKPYKLKWLEKNGEYKQDEDQKRRQVDFEVGDFVWVVLTKDRFPVGEYNKLSAKNIDPLEIVEKINSNAYRLKLPSHIRCTDVFNVKHLLPYYSDSSDDDLVKNSRTNFVYPEENDADPSVKERALLFLEAYDRVKKMPLFKVV
nr:putative reverse transcriptase domain-containing protein [Tanacetum cinerariifolium]